MTASKNARTLHWSARLFSIIMFCDVVRRTVVVCSLWWLCIFDAFMNEIHTHTHTQSHITKYIYSIYMFRGFLLHHHDYGLVVTDADAIALLFFFFYSFWLCGKHCARQQNTISLALVILSYVQWSILIHLFELKMRRKIVFVNAFRIYKDQNPAVRWRKSVSFSLSLSLQLRYR